MKGVRLPALRNASEYVPISANVREEAVCDLDAGDRYELAERVGQPNGKREPVANPVEKHVARKPDERRVAETEALRAGRRNDPPRDEGRSEAPCGTSA